MYVGHVSTASNRADWQEVVVLTDLDTDELIDISQCRITMTVVRRPSNPNSYGDGYYDGPPSDYGIALQGSTDTGEITLIADGTFQWSYPKDRMASLCQGEYQVGVRLSQDERTVQLIIGTVNIDEGIDNQ